MPLGGSREKNPGQDGRPRLGAPWPETPLLSEEDPPRTPAGTLFPLYGREKAVSGLAPRMEVALITATSSIHTVTGTLSQYVCRGVKAQASPLLAFEAKGRLLVLGGNGFVGREAGHGDWLRFYTEEVLFHTLVLRVR